ncbi:hypothetical protein [Roseivivax marinus]|uniref:hypothetical protein n=1 Tax=Roseivivax marinus TaxID=1379903 RepID=UPI00103F8C89|nr:hypothetical protein [Roseivivax marinus]
MATEYDRLMAFVASLQENVSSNKSADSLRELVDDSFKGFVEAAKLSGGIMSVRSKNSDEGTLRVVDPTPSIASVKIEQELEPRSADFFLTRGSGEGAAETRFLGTAKYPASNGEWQIRFDTERFISDPSEPLVMHAEVTDARGNLVALIQDMPIS